MPRSSPAYFHLLLASVAYVACNSERTCLSAPTVTDNASFTMVDNGVTSFTLDKSVGGLTSLELGGAELLGGGLVYFDANVSDIGSTSNNYWRLGTTNPATFSYSTGTDFVDVAVHHSATTYMPFDVTTHYVMRDGEQGFHLYSEFEHTTAMADKTLNQTRMVVRGDPNLFDHHSVTDTRYGIMPTPAELAAGTVVQDATTQLNPGTAYEAETGKNVYTKYDWSLDYENQEVIGYYGNTYGAWLVQPHQETQGGGPPKQKLTVHQTTTTPVLLGMLTDTHYGTTQSIDFVGDMYRTFGPFYVHFNSGPDRATMRADAKTYADRSVHTAFYDTLGIPGWTQTASHSNVSGLLQLAAGESVDGATIIISDNNTDFQFSTEGRQYWSKANPDGTFDVSGVSPGTYRLTAYVPGVYGELIMDDVVVGTGTTENLGTLNWQPPDHGTDLWQIGTFDRTGEEFRHGANDEYRQWGRWFDYPAEFPNDVNFVVGQSAEATDWNYAHWESSPTPWEIEFDSSAIRGDRQVTLTGAIAGHQNGRLNIHVNGSLVTPEFVVLPNSSSVLARSGIRGAYSSFEITFSSDLLVDGTNKITLEHINPNLDPANYEGIVYDALRLEVDTQGDFDLNNRVDGADFLKWQRGESPRPLSQAELAEWTVNYGEDFAAGPLVLLAHADTDIQENNPDDVEGSESRMLVRSRNVSGSGRQNVSYVRFNLLGEADISDAVLELTTSNTTSWLAGQLQVYGLNDVPGNTPQDWTEAGSQGLTFNTTGAEIPGDGNAETQDLGSIGTTGTENLWLLGDLPTLNPNPGDTTVQFSSTELLNFLNSRNGGLASILIVNANGTDRSVLFHTKEVTGQEPRLILNAGALGTAQTVPEPGSGIVALVSFVWSLAWRW